MSEYFKKSLLFSSIIFSSFVFLFSCSVGLGESVDTEVPKVEITYPPASRAVRDWFLLAGTCSDDKGVDSITVSAENISTNETVEFGTVSPAKDGSWSIRINEKDENGNFRLKDGTYTFCAIAKDSSKQNSAPNYRTLEIDNTPPVFVIKNPGTTNGSAPASFGSILKVVGAAADEHEIYELVLSVYDSADMTGEPKAVLSEKNVDKTDGINVTLARYNIDVENDPSKADELHNNYVKLYDVTGGGDQQFYASVTLKDSAEVWQDSKKSQADSIGNSTDGALYLNDSVYDKLMGKNSEYKLTAADFMKLLNGTFSSSAGSADRSAVSSSGGVLDEKTQAEILNILSENRTDTLKNPVAFKLNKDANPSYEIMGFSFKSGDIATFGSHKAAKQSSLTFKASAGRDGTSVKPSSLKVYLFGPYDSCTAETLEKIRTEPESFYESSMKEAEEAAKKSMGGGNPTEELVAGFATARIIADYSESGASSTETFTESIELPNTITKGKFYALAASGEDIDGLSLATQNYYGFVGESAGTPPSVLINGFEDGKMANELKSIKISGTLSSDETEIAGVTYSISVRDEIKAKTVGKISGDAELSFGGNKLSATWEIADIQKGSVSLEEGYSSCVPEVGERFKYTVTVSGKDSTGLESKDTKSFEIDRKKPEIKINDITPVAKKETDSTNGESKYIVNGKIKFSAVVTDTNLSSVVASVSDSISDADGEPKILYSGGNSTVEAEFDTTEFKDEDFLTFSVTAEDSAGNISVSERKDVFVSQATDNPVVNFTNGTLSSGGISSWDDIANGKNVFGIENNNSANFSLTDDDGIDSVVVSVYDENNKLIGSKEEGAQSIEAAQIQKQENSENAKETAENPVTYNANRATTYSVSYVLPKAAGKYKIKIEVLDTEYSGADEANKKWHSSVAEGYVLVSEGNISISFVDITNNTCQVQASKDHKIEGTVSLSAIGKLKSLDRFDGVKNTDESGSVTWSQSDSASSKYPCADSETDVTKKITVVQGNGRLSWTDTLPGSSIADGEQHFFYKATGVDGNSAVIELICNGDGNAPEVINNTDFSKWNRATAVKLSVLAADVYGADPSGISKVTYSYKKGDTDFSGELARGNSKYTADGKEDKKSGTYYEYSTTVDFDEGSTSISITAEDNVGNSAKIGPLEVKVDTKAPEKKELKIAENLFKKNTDKVQVSYAFSDATSGISKIEFCTNRNFKLDDKTYKSVECSGAKDYGTAEALETEEISLTDLKDGEYKIYARATDVAGNVSDIVETGSFTVDTTAPVVKITSPVSGSTVNKTISLRGTVVDNNLSKNKTPVLLYKNGSAWTELKFTSSTLDGQSWTISGIDTTQLYKMETSKEFEFNVQFTDDAGNTSEAVSYKLNVDQNSDRPVIKLTNIKISGSAVSSNIVQGVISDDDGVAGNLKLYRIDKNSYESNKKIPSDSGNAWKEVKVELGTGIWKAELAADEAQGAKNWYFYVIDEDGGKFCTTESSSLSRPYISDSVTSEKTDNTEGISFFYDTIAPEVEISVGYDGNTFSETNSIFGGNEEAGKNKIYVRATVTEEVGMASTNPVVLFVGGKRLEQTGAYPKCSSSKNENGVVVYTYDFEPVDVSSSKEYKDGSLSISVMAEDSSGLSNKDMLNVTIDKSAPTIKIVSPTTAVSDAVTGSVTIKGIAQDNASSVSKIQYLIPTVDQVKDNDFSSGWKEVGNSGSWEIQFASGAAESSDSLLYYVNAKDGESHKYAVEPFGAEGENIWKVPIYFKVSDSCGNEAIRTTDNDGKPLYVLVDPDGGKPKVWVNSPEEDPATSGLVTVYGGASDDVSVARVELQFDANGDGKIDSDDFDVINDGSGAWAGTAVKENLKGSGADWYILANGTNSWKVPVDTDKIAGSSDKKFIFRVRAFDGDGNTRDWSNVVTVKIDSEVPVIKDLKVVQFGKGVTADSSKVSGLTPVSEREYLSGMYISHIMEEANGTFYLVGTITDNSCVKSVTFEKQTTASSVNNIDLGLTEVTNNSDSYNLCVPLKTDVSGQINYIIKAHDDNRETAQSVVINIDSTKPGMYTTGGAESENIGSNLRLKSLGKNLGTEAGNSTVVNSDGYFTFGDTVSEAGSGLAFVVAVFERSGTTGGRRIYNPMKKDAKLSLAENETESSASGKPYISDEGFAVQSFDVERLSEDSIQSAKFAESANAAFIQKGGLVRIAGTYCLITDFDSSAGKITLSKSVSDKFKKAEIIFGQVIDHQIVETFKSDGTVENDDGDGMCETIRQLGASYTWTASVDSTNIPDGPVTVHVVAIDNAGNTNCGLIATKVENNRPRIAKVMLATDLNGNGKFDYDANSAPVTGDTAETLNERTSDGAAFGEFSFYSGMTEKSTNLSSEVKLNSSGFKVIEKLAVLPEFVGGNGDIGYILKTAANSSSSDYSSKSEGSVKSLQKKEELVAGGKFADKSTNPFGVTYEDLISEKGGIVLDSDSVSSGYLSFTFWDSTEETTPGTDSQWAHLKIPVTVLSDEKELPVPAISPFYWNSKTENSVATDSNGNVLGHIELEADLTPEIIEAYGDSSSMKKPKVSGKIKIEGTVKDNVRLGAISMGFDDLFAAATIATYENGAWTNSALPDGVESVEVEDVYISQNGHEAKFTVVVDTEKLSGVAAKDKSITVSATDWKSNISAAGAAQTTATAETALYTVDVVPYVTGVGTDLSEFYRSAPSVYARTARGRYPVNENETITLKGFNLGTSPKVELSGVELEMKGSGLSYNIGEAAKSGNLEVTVSGIKALNNLNSDSAEYNKQPNGVNNNTLNDNLEFDVWEFKAAATAKNGPILQPHMKVSPAGQLGFSYANATLYFNMPGVASNGTSYGQTPFGRNFGGFTQNAFTYDSAGNAYGVALCPDTSGEAGMSANLQFFSRKSALYGNEGGGDLNNNYYNQPNARRIENTSIKLDGSSITQNINRILSPSMATYTENGTTYVYVAYYDELSRQVRFRVGSVETSANDIGMGLVDLAGSGVTGRVSGSNDVPKLDKKTTRDSISGYITGSTETIDVLTVTKDIYVLVASSYGYNHIHAWGGYITDVGYPGVEMPLVAGYYVFKMPNTSATNLILNNGKDGDSNKAGGGNLSISESGVYEWNGSGLAKVTSGSIKYQAPSSTMPSYDGYKYCQVVAASGVSGGTAEYASATSKRAGQYVAVGSLSDGTAVMAWYDSGSGRLSFSYNESPRTAQASLDSGTKTWQDNSYYVSDANIRAGTYVSMAVDNADGIHLAYYSATGGDLYYSYIAAPKTKTVTKTVIVDSYGSVGTYTMIDVARNVEYGTFVPYISYRCESNSDTTASVKIAYPVSWDSTGNVLIGVDSSDRYTGNWEVSVVPTDNTPLSDYTNVGLNKNSNGVRQAFAEGSDTSKSWSATFAVSDSTIVYGNGTSNPVVSYAVSENGVLEMAQKK